MSDWDFETQKAFHHSVTFEDVLGISEEYAVLASRYIGDHFCLSVYGFGETAEEARRNAQGVIDEYEMAINAFRYKVNELEFSKKVDHSQFDGLISGAPL